METVRASLLVVTIAIAACGGTVISTVDEIADGKGGSASHGGSASDASVGKGGSAGLGGSPGSGGSPGLGGSPGTGGTAGCGDISSDPKNCGACAHDCQGGACEAGFCQPVEIGQTGPEYPFRLLVDDTHLFLGCGDVGHSVSKMPKGGGAVEVILPPDAFSWDDFALLGDSVYLLTTLTPGSRIARVAKSGGPTSTVWEGALLGWLVADSQHLFFGVEEGTETSVRRLDPSDGAAQVLAGVPNGDWHGLEVDESSVYTLIAAYYGKSTLLYRTSKQGGTPELLLSVNQVTRFFPHSGDLYYVTKDGEYPWGPANLLRVTMAGGAPETLIDESAEHSVTPIAFDPDRLWFGRTTYDDPLTTDVMVAPLAGGASKLVATEVVKSDFASDETFLYWVRESGAIMRLVR